MATDRKLTVTTGEHDYDDIPGTYVFDFDKSHQGFHLNMFCMSLLKPENREAFLADEKACLKRFPMTDEQRQAVMDRDWLGMIKLGGNIYYTSKIAATDGKSFQYVAGKMCGMSQDEYARMMLNGGRSPDGNRRKSEWQEGDH